MCYHTVMSTYHTDSRVDDYINALPDWQQDMCRHVRDLVHAADPEVRETIKRTRQPYFTLEGNICALLSARCRRYSREMCAASAKAWEVTASPRSSSLTARAVLCYARLQHGANATRREEHHTPCRSATR